MAEQKLPPFFQVEEGAPPGTLQAFANLTALIIEQPAEAQAVFGKLGDTAEDIQRLASTHELTPDAEYRLRLAHACGALLYERMDEDVEMGTQIDHEMHRARTERGMNRHLLRIRRMGAFVEHTSRWAQKLTNADNTADATKAA
ncbi:MAG TPA: hypothetical protein VLF43_04980 [Candidatus Saccharimonadales bacterium]|nr:hypothetical protein [Candidatus Saccharimonadales bacterium]